VRIKGTRDEFVSDHSSSDRRSGSNFEALIAARALKPVPILGFGHLMLRGAHSERRMEMPPPRPFHMGFCGTEPPPLETCAYS
jgi:hypothetical protein